jgi:hypothetical protein
VAGLAIIAIMTADDEDGGSMLRVTGLLVGLLLVLMSISLPASAEKRIALLIANQGYSASVGTLKNPFKDIVVVGDALSKQGFEILPPIKDGKRSAMLGGVRDFARRLNAAGDGAIGFIYYSGHGAAEKDTNVNYLIPVDASAPGTSAFWDDSVKLDDVLRLLDGARSAAKFIVFDACRNELQLPTKDTSKGLVPVAEQQGMFIAYASAPGRTASDMGDKSGPYAAALAAELAKPGLDHLNLFQNVKEAVLASTGGAQQPWESNGLGHRVYLTGQTKPAETAPVWRFSEAAEAWDRAKDTTSIPLLEMFIARYKDTYYANLARARIEDIKRGQVAIATPPVPSAASNSAPPKAPVPSHSPTRVDRSAEDRLRSALEIWKRSVPVQSQTSVQNGMMVAKWTSSSCRAAIWSAKVSELNLSEAYMKNNAYIAIPCRDKNAKCVLVESACHTASMSQRNKSEFILYAIPRVQAEAAIRELK